MQHWRSIARPLALPVIVAVLGTMCLGCTVAAGRAVVPPVHDALGATADAVEEDENPIAPAVVPNPEAATTVVAENLGVSTQLVGTGTSPPA